MYDAKSTFFVSFEHFWADFVPVPVRYLSGGLSSPEPSRETPSSANILTLGPQNWLQINKKLRLYGKIDNVSNQQGIVSRRPFGARASKPRQLIVGVKYKF